MGRIGNDAMPLSNKRSGKPPVTDIDRQDIDKKSDLLQGTLDLLILKTLSLEPLHGWGISQRIQQISQDVLQVNQGSLYPALHRLELNGFIGSEWGTSDNNRKAKYYRLTTAGRRQLKEETENWDRLSGAIGRVLRTT